MKVEYDFSNAKKNPYVKKIKKTNNNQNRLRYN